MSLVPEDRKGAGCRADHERARQRHPAAAVGVQHRGLAASVGAQVQGGEGHAVGTATQPWPEPVGRHPVRRQPAEGRDRPLADRRRQGAAAGRADPRRRRRRPLGDLQDHHRSRRQRDGGDHGLLRHARDPRPVPPGVRDARRHGGGRARPRRAGTRRRPGLDLPVRCRSGTAPPMSTCRPTTSSITCPTTP